MNKNVFDAINKKVAEFMKSEEYKKQAKQCIIDYLKSEESDGYIKVDDALDGILDDNDWKEIAKEVGEGITKMGEYVFTRDGIINCDFWKHFKAK